MPGNYGNSYKSIRVRRGLLANIPALRDGEPGFCTDTKQLAVGWQGTNYFFALAAPAPWAPHPSGGAGGSPLAIAPAVGLPAITAETWQWWFITGTTGAQAVTATTQVPAGSAIGQMLKLTGSSNVNYPIFQDGNGLKLNGPWPAQQDTALILSWDGAAWAEESRR